MFLRLIAVGSAVILLTACSSANDIDDSASVTVAPSPTPGLAFPVGTEPPTTITTTTSTEAAPETDIPAVCGPLSEVVAANDEASLLMNEINQKLLAVAEQGHTITDADAQVLFADFRSAIESMGPEMDEVIRSYNAAIAVAPDDLVADLMALRDGSTVMWPIMADAAASSDTIEEFAVLFEAALSDPDSGFEESIYAAGSAVLRLDEFTIPQCGFKLSNS